MQQNSAPRGEQRSAGLSRTHRVLAQGSQDVSLRTAEHRGWCPCGHQGQAPAEHTRVHAGRKGERGSSPMFHANPLIYLDWNNLSSAVILTTSVLRSQSGLVLIEAFMSSHKSSKMKTQGPLKYTPRVCAVQLEAFMTPVRAFMTL